MTPPICPYDLTIARLTSGREVYRGSRDPNLWRKGFWVCDTCGSRVGCHPGTSKPLGKLANKTLREARIEAHNAFDGLWRSGRMSRTAAYAELAKQLALPGERTHIGEFDEDMCRKAVEATRLIRLKALSQ